MGWYVTQLWVQLILAMLVGRFAGWLLWRWGWRRSTHGRALRCAAMGADPVPPLVSLEEQWRAPTVALDEVDAVLVFSFGNRITTEDVVLPGPVNEALAATTAAAVGDRALPVYAQWEVARSLVGEVRDLVTIEPEIDESGAVVYLSTRGVAEQAVRLATARGVGLCTVAVVAFADHAVRAVETVRAVGLDGGVPTGVPLPDRYDPESGQPWTRDRATYVALDLAARSLLR